MVLGLGVLEIAVFWASLVSSGAGDCSPSTEGRGERAGLFRSSLEAHDLRRSFLVPSRLLRRRKDIVKGKVDTFECVLAPPVSVMSLMDKGRYSK